MKKVKCLYNNNGCILACWNAESSIDLSGNLYMEVEIPDGKILEKIDITGDEPIPVFVDKPKDYISSELEDIKAQLSTTQDAINYILTGISE